MELISKTCPGNVIANGDWYTRHTSWDRTSTTIGTALYRCTLRHGWKVSAIKKDAFFNHSGR